MNANRNRETFHEQQIFISFQSIHHKTVINHKRKNTLQQRNVTYSISVRL